MKLIRIRQVSQAFFFVLFVALLCAAAKTSGGVSLGYPVSLFVQADPLAAVLSALSTLALFRGLLLSLLILVPTFFLGRFFCGWICPLGTLNHFFGSLRSEAKRGPKRIERNRYRPWQKLKYYILLGGLAAAALGCGILGFIDPISLAVRSFTLSILPALNYASARVFGFGLLELKQPHFRQALFTAAVLFVILSLNLRITRFWCRALCPLGALLGFASRWSLLRLDRKAGDCAACNRCLLHCQGGDDPIGGAGWRKAECHACLNCVADCPDARLSFRLGAAPGAPDLARRRALTGLAAGAALVPLARLGTAGVESRDRLIRPPGALDEPDFLARCIRCGECMKVCPANALHPAFLEGGLEGFSTPVVVPRIGYCQPACTLCNQVCPTGAIWRSGTEPVRIGTAFYDRGRCLPWALATECIVCEEWCPTSPKAIYLREAGGIRQPWVDADRCIGCGACEYACPVKDRPAVYVTSVGEARSRTNQFLLQKPVLPDAAEGWQRAGKTRSFDASNLWQYLDGGADTYVNAGLALTVTAPYRHGSGLEAVADVHQFRTAERAKRFFDSESSAGAVQLGDAARLYPSSLVFVAGAYLVRVTAFGDAPGASAAVAALGRAIEQRLRSAGIRGSGT